MLFSHHAIKMALASDAHPHFHEAGTLACTAVVDGGDGHGTNDHVSQLFILSLYVGAWQRGRGGRGIVG